MLEDNWKQGTNENKHWSSDPIAINRGVNHLPKSVPWCLLYQWNLNIENGSGNHRLL